MSPSNSQNQSPADLSIGRAQRRPITVARLKRAPAYGFLLARRKLDPRKIPDARRFRRRLRDFHRGLIRPGDLVFDIGANVGHYTRAYRELDASVIALEPDRVALRKLRRRFRRDRGVTIVAEGASNEKGTQQLFVSPEGGSECTTMSPEWATVMRENVPYLSDYSWKLREEVPVTTLDALIEEFGLPAFAKIDVEGYELYVVQGLSRPIPIISLESHPEVRDRTIGALDHLRSLGEIEVMYVPGAVAPFIGRAMPGEMGKWTDIEALGELLETSTRPGDFGDVLVRFKNAS